MFKIWIIDYTAWVANGLLNNLVSYYKCDTNGSFPDAHGSNDWTINGATYTASGKINWAYDYDWVNDTINTWTSTDFEINWSDNFSQSIWVNLDVLPASASNRFNLLAISEIAQPLTYD